MLKSLGLGALLAAAAPIAMSAALPAAAAQAESADALAAEAERTLIEAAYGSSDKDTAKAQLRRALELSDRALKLDPKHVNARFQRALALGYGTKLNRSRSDAKEARQILRDLVTENPRFAMGWAGLGGWHGEAVSNIGKFLAGTMIGAKTESALEAFARAHRLAPNDPVISTMYAINAIALKDRDSPAEIRALLQPVAQGSGGGRLAELMRANARALLTVVDDGAALRAKAYPMRPFDRFV